MGQGSEKVDYDDGYGLRKSSIADSLQEYETLPGGVDVRRCRAIMELERYAIQQGYEVKNSIDLSSQHHKIKTKQMN